MIKDQNVGKRRAASGQSFVVPVPWNAIGGSGAQFPLITDHGSMWVTGYRLRVTGAFSRINVATEKPEA